MAAPRLITAAEIGLSFQNLFGALGPEEWVTGHYSAGPVPKSTREGIELVKSYHAYHRSQGWGGLGYHAVILPNGDIILGRPTYLKGAHVGLHNSNNLGVMFPGSTGDKPTRKQARSYRWLLRNWHTTKLPKAHRSDRKLPGAITEQTHPRRLGHNDWSGHESNGCPGKYKYLIRHAERARG